MRRKSPYLFKTHLFEARKSGYATYRIPGIVITTKGTALAYCEARKSARGDWGHIDILMRRSTDDGCTWGPTRRISAGNASVPKNPAALQQGLARVEEQTFNNPVSVVDHQTGVVHFLFCAEYARCFYVRSDDDGRTFIPAADITPTFEAFRPEYDWNVIATGPGHGIQLRSGRLLVPVWLSTGGGGHAHRPSVVSVIYSDNHGETWKRGDIVVHHTTLTPNPSETAAVQLSDGRVMFNIRNESRCNRRLVAYSADGVTGWSEPVFDNALFEPICFGSLVRLSAGPHPPSGYILFVNPDSRNSGVGPPIGKAWLRQNLTVRLSEDEGQTWPVAKVLEPGISGYADLAVGPDATVYCLYEDGGIGGDIFHSARLTLARFNLAWLMDDLAA